MEEDKEEFQNKLKKLRPKKKLAVPKELLDQAKSYEEKLEAIKILVEREKSRAMLLIKSMLADANKPKRK